MHGERPSGSVLILADDPRSAERLREWIAAIGERPLALGGAERHLLERGTDDALDLVVTALDSSAPASHALLERMLSGELFSGVPQLHLLRDPQLRERCAGSALDVATLELESLPPPGEFDLRARLASEIGRLRRTLRRRAIHDELTGAFNRGFVLMRLEQEFARARRHGSGLALVRFGIDELAAINARYGRDAGDRVIRHAHEVLARRTRREELAGRTSASGFASLHPGASCRGAAVFANQVRGDVAALRLAGPAGALRVTLSAGISRWGRRRPLATAPALLMAAETALAEAQRRGGNRVFIDEAVLRAEPRAVLVADPDPEQLDLAEDLLSLEELRVFRADSARALLETLRFRRPDLLILDLLLSGSTACGALVQRIRELCCGAHLPIVGLLPAGRGGPPPRLALDAYLTKPFSGNVLRSVTRDLLA